jgi:type IV secretory pathway VirB2 component (pilin)
MKGLKTMKKHLPLIFMSVILFVAISPDGVLATTISEFQTPTETLMETLRGPWAKAVAIIMILAAAFMMWFKKDDLDGMAKGFLVVVCIISVLALAEPIINQLFSFGSGALI